MCKHMEHVCSSPALPFPAHQYSNHLLPRACTGCAGHGVASGVARGGRLGASAPRLPAGQLTANAPPSAAQRVPAIPAAHPIQHAHSRRSPVLSRPLSSGASAHGAAAAPAMRGRMLAIQRAARQPSPGSMHRGTTLCTDPTHSTTTSSSRKRQHAPSWRRWRRQQHQCTGSR